MWKTLEHCIPNDHAEQVESIYFVEMLMKAGRPGQRVLDLGCGTGRSVDWFRQHDPTVDWCGLDITSSPEVAQRDRDDAAFFTYDGVNIPFGDAEFDLVYSHQTFEHVRYPDQLLREVTRILEPGGAFIGSVSALEPFHSFSYRSFTPYGWHELLKDAGLEPIQFRPGIDGVALIERQYRGRPPELDRWLVSSPLNDEIDAWGEQTSRRPALVNLRKLQFCGHLVFHARKPARGEAF